MDLKKSRYIIVVRRYPVVSAGSLWGVRQGLCGCLALLATWTAVCAEEFYREPSWKPRVTLPARDALAGFWPASIAPSTVRFDEPGLAEERLGKVPPPGVHPRVYLTPDDVARIRAKIRLGDRAPAPFLNIWNRIKDQKTPLVACLTQNNELGGQLAREFVRRLDKIEKTLDAIDRSPDGDNLFCVEKSLVYAGDQAGQTSVFGLMAYDYLYEWLSDAERARARKAISRASARISNFMSVPDHFMINNHQCFGMTFLGLLLQIEGEEGFHPEIYRLAARKMRALLDYYLNSQGMCYETIKGWLPMSEFAPLFKRDPRLLRHSHLHAKMNFYLNWLRFENGVWKNREEMRDSAFHVIWMMHYYFPANPRYEFLYSATFSTNRILIDPKYRWTNPVGTNYENLLLTAEALPARDYTDPTVVGTFRLPTFWSDPQRGYLSARNSWKPGDLYLNFAGKQDMVYRGHEGNEHGRWAMWADGVNWVFDNDMLFNKAGHLQNMITVDGKSVQWPPVSAVWLGAGDSPDGAWAATDYKDGYSYRKVPVHPLAFPSLRKTYWEMFGRENMAHSRDQQVEFHEPAVRFFDGYAHTDYGLWNGEQRLLEDYREWNPMEKAARTVILARGPRPYVMMIDDLRKDGGRHQFAWNAILPDDVTLLSAVNPEFTGMEPKALDANDLILGKLDTPRNLGRRNYWEPLYQPKRGAPQLLVRVFDRRAEYGYPAPAVERSDRFTLLTVPSASVEPDYKVMLFPHRAGESLPKSAWNVERNRFQVEIDGRVDVWHFGKTDAGRTAFALERDGKIVLRSEAAPARPALRVRDREFRPDDARYTRTADAVPVWKFADAIEVTADRPLPPAVLRYTLDGSEPDGGSPLFPGTLRLDRSATLSLRVIDPAWKCGPIAGRSTVAEFRKEPLRAGTAAGRYPGVRARLYEINTKIWDDKGFFRAGKSMLPKLDDCTPVLDGLIGRPAIFHATPQKPMIEQAKGFYRFNGKFHMPRSGAGRFAVRSNGPVSLTIGDKPVIRETGVFHQNWKERSGECVLAEGWHPFELIVTDPVFWKVNSENAMPFSFRVSVEGGEERELVFFGSDSARSPLAVEEPVSALRPVDPQFRLEPGVERRMYDRPGKTDLTYVPHPDLLDVDGVAPRGTALCDRMEGNDSNSSLVSYEGFFLAPQEGAYEFDTPAREDARIDMNQLRLNGEVIVQRGVPGRNPGRRVWLSPGYYALSFRLGDSRGELRVRYPDGRWEILTAARLFRPIRPTVSLGDGEGAGTVFEFYAPTDFRLALPESGTGMEMRYTLDGSEPGPRSALFTAPVPISASAVLRCAGFENGVRATQELRAELNRVTVPLRDQLVHLTFGSIGKDRAIDGAQAYAAFDARLVPGGLHVNRSGILTQSDRETNVDRSKDGIGLAVKDLKFDRSAMTVVMDVTPERFPVKLFGKWGFNAIGKGYVTVRAEVGGDTLRVEAPPARLQAGKLKSGERVHLVFTGDTGRCAFYVNGKLAGRSDGSPSLATESLDLLIGAPATIHELRIYKRALSAREAKRLYERRKSAYVK